MNHGSLFSGIGGFDLAADWMGWNNLFHCEWNEFGQRVLKYYWPNAKSYGDITKTDFSIYRGKIDVLSGGFPCQPYSLAGKRLGKEDERHLWPEMLRAIREIQPRWVVGENVFGLINWNGGLVFDEVQADLEAEGYEVQAYVLPAASINAPHRRDRVWFVAYSNKCNDGRATRKNEGTSRKERIQKWNEVQQPIKPTEVFKNAANALPIRLQQCENGGEMGTGQEKICGQGSQFTNGVKTDGEVSNATNSNSASKQGKHIGQARKGQFNRSDSRDEFNNFQNFPTQSPICGGDDGFPSELDGITFSKWRNESIKAYGNAVVPQVVLQIFKSIQNYERIQNS